MKKLIILLLTLLTASCQTFMERMERPSGEPQSTDFSDHFPSFCIKTYPGVKEAFNDIPDKISFMNDGGPLLYVMGISFWLVDTPVSAAIDTLLYPLDSFYSDTDDAWKEKYHRRFRCHHKNNWPVPRALISQWRESEDKIEFRYRNKFTEDWQYIIFDKSSLCCDKKGGR